MPFPRRTWENWPSVNTPITGDALTDLENRIGNYLDGLTGFLVADVPTTGRILQSQGGADPTLVAFPYYPPSSTAVGISTAGEFNDNAGGNRLQLASYIRNVGSRPAVGLWSSAQGPHSFGINPGAVTLGWGTAIGEELDFGNFATVKTKAAGSQSAASPTINAVSTSGIRTAGTFQVTSTSGVQTITYTGVTPTSFTGCSGGVGTIADQAVIDPQPDGAGAIAYGLVIYSKQNGGPPNPNGAFIQMGADGSLAQVGAGINFYNGPTGAGNGPVVPSGSLIKTSGDASQQAYGVNFATGAAFSSAAIKVPINRGSAGQSYGIYIQAEGGFANTGAGIQMGGDGTSKMNAGLSFFGDAFVSTGALITSSGASTRFGFDVSGSTLANGLLKLGANKLIDSATRPALTYSRTGEPASTAAIRTLLANMGLLTDSTVA